LEKGTDKQFKRHLGKGPPFQWGDKREDKQRVRGNVHGEKQIKGSKVQRGNKEE